MRPCLKPAAVGIVLAALLVAAPSGHTPARAERVSIAVSTPLLVSADIPEEAVGTGRAGIVLGAFEKALRDARKFRVLTRRAPAEAAIADEQARKQSLMYDGDGARSGEQATAQYRMVVTLIGFRFHRIEDPLADMDGRYRRIDEARLALETQVVDTTTGEIVDARDAEVERHSDAKIVSRTGGRPEPGVLADAARTAARETVGDFLANVFPMTVVKATDERVWINVGGDTLDRGESLRVFGVGEGLTDPATDESLGRAEIPKGRVEIVRTMPKVSIAEIVTTEGPIAAGDIVRRDGD